MLTTADLPSLPTQVSMYLLLALVGSASLNVWLLISKRYSLYLQDEQNVQQWDLKSSPKGWWGDEEFFQAERRAIFSKTWICVSHRGRFTKPGDYVAHELAGFRFFIILGKDGEIRTFHNICRHRAFPVTKKASGSATVLGCKYHGWSYNTRGELTKAPHFDNVPGFEKSNNSLFEIHTKVDDSGFIHINLSGDQDTADTKPSDAIKIGRPARVNSKSQLLHVWEMEGKYNWKIAGWGGTGEGTPNSNHVSSGTHPRAFSTEGLTPTGQLRFFPLTTIYTKNGRPFWYQITLSPGSATSTTLRCELYSIKQSETSQANGIKDSLEAELKQRIRQYEQAYKQRISPEATAENLTSEDRKIAETVSLHLGQEEVEGSEIKPATVQQYRSAAYLKAEEICQAMQCGNDKLAW